MSSGLGTSQASTTISKTDAAMLDLTSSHTGKRVGQRPRVEDTSPSVASFWFNKPVTQEQAEFAQPFEDHLRKLQQERGKGQSAASPNRGMKGMAHPGSTAPGIVTRQGPLSTAVAPPAAVASSAALAASRVAPSTAASSSNPATVPVLAATSSSLPAHFAVSLENATLPPTTSLPGEGLNMSIPSLPSDVFFSPEQLAQLGIEDPSSSTTATSTQENGVSAVDNPTTTTLTILSVPPPPAPSDQAFCPNTTAEAATLPLQQAMVSTVTCGDPPYQRPHYQGQAAIRTRGKQQADYVQQQREPDEVQGCLEITGRKRIKREYSTSSVKSDDCNEYRRERNREAARKCRQGKKDRIAKLMKDVERMKDENKRQRESVEAMKASRDRQRQEIEKHKVAGCHFSNTDHRCPSASRRVGLSGD